MIDKTNLSKLGIGAWGIGGFAERDLNNNDEKQIKALVYQLERGMNFIEVNFWNSEGKSVEIIKEALKRAKVKRNKIFIENAIYHHTNNTLDDIKKEFENCLRFFETDYVDSILFGLPAFNKYGYDELVEFIKDCLAHKKARYTSVTNFNLGEFKKYHRIFKDRLFSHELHYSFEIRENEDSGLIDYAIDNNIVNMAYQSLRRGRTSNRNWPILADLASKYNKTQNQIILNWMSTRGIYPLIKSETIEHIDENLAAFEFAMDKKDIDKLTEFRVKGYQSPKIDWLMEGKEGVFVHHLPNIFDENYPENT